jgi:hypothetical protein
MESEKVPREIWIDTVSGKINCEYEFLALKILLSRLKLDMKRDSSPEAFQKYADDLKSLFIRSQRIPSAQNDLKKIIRKGGM